MIYNFPLPISLALGSIGVIRLEIIEAKGLKSVDSFLTGGNISIISII